MSGSKVPRLQAKVEYMVVEGAEGEALEERQLAVIMEVLEWVRQATAGAPGREPGPEEHAAA
jgi:hypothetical protein